MIGIYRDGKTRRGNGGQKEQTTKKARKVNSRRTWFREGGEAGGGNGEYVEPGQTSGQKNLALSV